MKFLRPFAAVALAVTAFGFVAPSASAKSPLCPDCLTEGVVQGSGIMPDPTKLSFILKVVTYGTDPLAVPQIRTISFIGDIVDGDPNSGSFQASGSITSDIPTGIGSATFNTDSASVVTSDSVDIPTLAVNPIALNGEDAEGVRLFVELHPKVQTGIPALNLWNVGRPFVGQMYMFG